MRRGSRTAGAVGPQRVSIPFSSGQRMRLNQNGFSPSRNSVFQSPFHRVKGCDLQQRARGRDKLAFQSPFHRVKGCDFTTKNTTIIYYRRFQSPFHRVKGCDCAECANVFQPFITFQSPFHRVKGCDRGRDKLAGGGDGVSIPFSSGQRMRRVVMIPLCVSRSRVSIPFSSGQRMRPYRAGVASAEKIRFNPLFIGSKDATGRGSLAGGPLHRVSIPFSSGQRMRPL